MVPSNFMNLCKHEVDFMRSVYRFHGKMYSPYGDIGINLVVVSKEFF